MIHGLITAVGIARLYPHIAASQVSDIRKLDLATEPCWRIWWSMSDCKAMC